MNFNPFECCVIKNPSSSNFSTTILINIIFFFVISLLFMSIIIPDTIISAEGALLIPDGNVKVSQNIEDDFHRKYDNQLVLNDAAKNFKKIKTPSNGCVRLINGKVNVIHHSIKEDSIIMLSRKSVDGIPGEHLVVDIDPNKSFTIKSIKLTDDKLLSTQDQDCGEIFFTCI